MVNFPPADLRRRLNDVGGRLLDCAETTSIDTQYLMEAAADGSFQDALAEIQQRPVSPDTHPVEELEKLVAEKPLLEHITAASGFYAEQWPSWAKTLYKGTPEEVAAALERGGGEAFVENLREADKVLGEAARLAPQLTAPAIGRLARIVDDESYEAIKRGLDANLETLAGEGTLSYNQVFHATGSKGEKLIIKASGNARKARIEAAANYHFSRHAKLTSYVAAGREERPIEVNGLYLTIQEEVLDKRSYDAHHYMVALAHLHTYGHVSLPKQGISLPEWESKTFDNILADIDRSESTRPWERLRSQYEALAGRVREVSEKVLIHGDAKADNLRFGKLLDLEGLKVGDPALDLALYLGSSAILSASWGKYIHTYLMARAEEEGESFDSGAFSTLLQRTKMVAPLVLFKEYGGLASRRLSPKWSERQERQQSFFNYFLAA